MFDKVFRIVWSVCFVMFYGASIFVGVTGCNRTVVRDATVYEEELDFFDASSAEVIENSKALIKASCQCERQGGELKFVSEECQNLAETVVVMDARVKYHTDMARYNGGLTEVRPLKDAPAIEEANSLCP